MNAIKATAIVTLMNVVVNGMRMSAEDVIDTGERERRKTVRGSATQTVIVIIIVDTGARRRMTDLAPLSMTIIAVIIIIPAPIETGISTLLRAVILMKGDENEEDCFRVWARKICIRSGVEDTIVFSEYQMEDTTACTKQGIVTAFPSEHSVEEVLV